MAQSASEQAAVGRDSAQTQKLNIPDFYGKRNEKTQAAVNSFLLPSYADFFRRVIKQSKKSAKAQSFFSGFPGCVCVRAPCPCDAWQN